MGRKSFLEFGKGVGMKCAVKYIVMFFHLSKFTEQEELGTSAALRNAYYICKLLSLSFPAITVLFCKFYWVVYFLLHFFSVSCKIIVNLLFKQFPCGMTYMITVYLITG